MKKKLIILAGTLLVMVGLTAVYLHSHNVAILNPKGTIAAQQRHLLIIGCLLSLVVIIPVYFLTFTIAWRYREGNKKAKYSPDWDHSVVLESIWWLVPLTLITIMSVITWRSSHQLDPFKPIAADAKTMTIQVVALDWKWLFIYPEQNIATVNFVEFPAQTPVDFEITADAPMNSFWIPQLGGQIYAMSGMATHLNLMADAPGDFRGLSANISGKGFAGMKFTARAANATDYDNWVHKAKGTGHELDLSAYNQLVKPSENNPVSYYSSVEGGLYNQIVMKYMPEGHGG